MSVAIALHIFLFLQMEISYQSDAQNGRQGSVLSELAGWSRWRHLIRSCFRQEKWHEMEQLKGNFHTKNSGKEIWLRTNGLEVGGNTSQSPKTHLISQENAKMRRRGRRTRARWEQSRWLRWREGNATQSPHVSQEENLQGIFKVHPHICLPQTCDKIRINLLYWWRFVVIYLCAYTAQLTQLHKQCSVANYSSYEAVKYVPKQ